MKIIFTYKKLSNMMFKTILSLCIGFLLFSSCNTTSESERFNLAGSRPNIIYILADDLSYRDLSVYGQELYQTPNLDRLATSGMRFTQAYAAAPECAPSRGSLMTGLHTGHGPIRVNASARGQDHLRPEDITVAEVLKEAGYKTGFAGKWGIGMPGTEGVPYKQGFDYAFGFYDQLRAHTFFPYHLWENDQKIPYPANQGFDMQRRYNISTKGLPAEFWNVYDENGDLQLPEIADPANAVYSEAEIEKAALKFVRESHEDPFFLYFATQLPHGPVIIDNIGDMAEPDSIPQPSREWAAMVQQLDTFTGELVDLLKELGVYENTIIFFSSDNGYSMCGYMGRGNSWAWPDDPYLKNKGPFTGGKFSPLEGGIRIPFFVHWPAKFKPGFVAQPVWLPDFFPTAAALAGTELPHELDGLSLLPVLEQNDQQAFPYDRPLYFYKNNEQAVRMGPWKAYRRHPDQPIKLYLVEEDTYGERDLAAHYPEIVQQMEQIMKEEHEPHEWYWNPGMTRTEFQAKQKLAEESGQKMPQNRPNGL